MMHVGTRATRHSGRESPKKQGKLNKYCVGPIVHEIIDIFSNYRWEQGA